MLAHSKVQNVANPVVEGRDTTLRELIDAPTVPSKHQAMALDA